MDDEQWKARLKSIKDPREFLRELVNNWSFVGADPYYRDLNDALYEKAQELAEFDSAVEQDKGNGSA